MLEKKEAELQQLTSGNNNNTRGGGGGVISPVGMPRPRCNQTNPNQHCVDDINKLPPSEVSPKFQFVSLTYIIKSCMFF